MFAVVANGIQTICRTQRQLDNIIAIYPYPKFAKCATEEAARQWLLMNKRSFNELTFNNYGDTVRFGYITVDYIIANDNIYYNLNTSKFGKLRIKSQEDVYTEVRSDLVKVKVCNVKLNDELISHHVLAIRRCLKFIGDYADINFVLPDISIYLAATKYRGKNYIMKGLQKDIAQRLGGVSFSVREF